MADRSRKSVSTGRGAAGLALLLALGAGQAAPACGEPVHPPLLERVRAVLAAHCAECRAAHQSGDSIDLEAVAEDTRLIVPRRPDASRAYQHLVRDQAILAAGNGGPMQPSPADVEAVRDWIEGLPDLNVACRNRAAITQKEIEAALDKRVGERPASEIAGSRALSLAALWNSCESERRITEAGEALTRLLTALARRSDPVPIETLNLHGAILVVHLRELALSPEEWRRLKEAAPAPAGKHAIVPAEWLAAHLLAHPKDATGSVDPAFDVKFDAASHIAVDRLARLWTRDVTLRRAAAERGVSPAALSKALQEIGGEFLAPARKLMHGAITRSAWERLARALDGEAPPGSAERGTAVPDNEIDVVLWTDKSAYHPRDLVTIHASVSKACHLTLIDVDRDGKAIVLFPNELEQDNLVVPSAAFSVPGRDAGYQFRFERSGEEQIVAICQRKSRRPAGIAYDYERERFAILGDWRAFLREIPEREKKIRDREERQTSRRNRRTRQPAEAAIPPIGAEDTAVVEGRAAITVVIEPGKM